MPQTPDIPTPPPAENPADIAAAKRACRDAGHAIRRELDLETCFASADALAKRLLALPELADARLVLAYSPTAEEIDVRPTVDALRARGVEIAYPRIEERGVLGVHLVASELDLVPGPFGIMEPSAAAPRPDVATIDAVIVPGVAFDRLGVRARIRRRVLRPAPPAASPKRSASASPSTSSWPSHCRANPMTSSWTSWSRHRRRSERGLADSRANGVG